MRRCAVRANPPLHRDRDDLRHGQPRPVRHGSIDRAGDICVRGRATIATSLPARAPGLPATPARRGRRGYQLKGGAQCHRAVPSRSDAEGAFTWRGGPTPCAASPDRDPRKQQKSRKGQQGCDRHDARIAGQCPKIRRARRLLFLEVRAMLANAVQCSAVSLNPLGFCYAVASRMKSRASAMSTRSEVRSRSPSWLACATRSRSNGSCRVSSGKSQMPSACSAPQRHLAVKEQQRRRRRTVAGCPGRRR